jgi:hypothetical protein
MRPACISIGINLSIDAAAAELERFCRDAVRRRHGADNRVLT